jgi:signal transduction histidine kinase
MRQDRSTQAAERAPGSPAWRRWAVLVVACGLIVLSIAQLAYRYTLPTDGWAVLSSDDLDRPDWIYLSNLVGAPSSLQRDDRLVGVAGLPVEWQIGTPLQPPPDWKAGQIARVQVVRQSQSIEVAIPVVQWTVAALWRMQLESPEIFVGLLGGLILTGLALYTFWQRPDAPAAGLLLLVGATFLAIQISQALPDGLSAQFDGLAFYATGVFSYLLFGVMLGPSLLAFTLQFPQPKRVLVRHPWLGLAPFGLGLLVGAALLSGQAPTFGWLATVGMLVASLVSFLHAVLTQRDTISRIQLQWAGCGLLVGIGLMLLVLPAASGMVSQPLLARLMGAGFQLGFTVLGIALAIAILRYRLFDIDLVVNRALVYAALTTGVIGVYVLVVGYLGWLFRSEGNLTLSLVATGLIAVGFAPARQLVQRGVNRLLYGERDEPYRVLSRLGQQLETAAAPSVVLAQAAETLARSLKLPYVAIVHHAEDGSRVLALTGTAPAHVTQVPLTYAGAAVGALVVAPRDVSGALSRADQRLLAEVARPISVVAHAAALQNRLEQARLRLVTERGEARRRLGSDLHDRIGHQLAAATRQVERASHLVGHDRPGAQVLLNDIMEQLRSIAQEVRGLAHALFPPELALLGLVEAIRERALAYAHLPVQILAPGSLPDLPAEVEAALYAITLEALTNIDKHAHASRCVIRFQIADRAAHGGPQLELLICDDGAGLSTGAARGVGLLSMQARAIEVGGSCQIDSRPGQGTSVRVRIPCTAE